MLLVYKKLFGFLRKGIPIFFYHYYVMIIGKYLTRDYGPPTLTNYIIYLKK